MVSEKNRSKTAVYVLNQIYRGLPQ